MVERVLTSADFLELFNTRAIPFLSANFMAVYNELMGLLKHVQPSTRVLHTHCVTIKQRLNTGAAASIPKLKRQLEELLFTVKVMLKENGADDAFWMGNLKHKNTKGEEVSSQMEMVVKPKKKAPAKPRKRKKKDAESEAEDEEGEEGGAQADDEAEEDGAPTDDEDAVQETNMDEEEEEEEEEEEGEGEDEYPASMIGDEDD